MDLEGASGALTEVWSSKDSLSVMQREELTWMARHVRYLLWSWALQIQQLGKEALLHPHFMIRKHKLRAQIRDPDFLIHDYGKSQLDFKPRAFSKPPCLHAVLGGDGLEQESKLFCTGLETRSLWWGRRIVEGKTSWRVWKGGLGAGWS